MSSLKGKTAVITGGSSGFGRGIVEALAAAGARVVVVARDKDKLAGLAKDITGVEVISGDATDAVLAARVIERERPHILGLVAGATGTIRPTRFQTWETFSLWWENDVRSTFFWAREALLLPLEKGSKIFLTSSNAAFDDSPALGGYAAAKAAIWALAHSLASEAAPLGIQVHCLLPILTPETSMGREAIRSFARGLGVPESEIIARKGLQQPVTPALVGQTVVNLAADADAHEVSYRITPRGAEPLPSQLRVNPLG
jgi:NAD(P)-dependent dehydrogenase (short-subunit alcohol dehydrogenase family)